MKSIKLIISLFAFALFSQNVFAQEKEASMSIALEKVDSASYNCNVSVISESKPVKDVVVKLYVNRLFGLLPVGKEVTTDENGVASFEFPNDIPLNKEGKLLLLAKVEDDENYGSFEAKTETNIGIQPDYSQFEKRERSLSASRDNAPYPFIFASLFIISGIWGTLIYVIFQAVRIQKPRDVAK